MKVLLFHPDVAKLSSLKTLLEGGGVGVVLTDKVEDAWAALESHGASMDVAVIHREHGSDDDAGLKFVQKFKGSKQHEDLPYILTTSKWTLEDCGKHQNEAHGANAYLVEPFVSDQLVQMLSAVTGKTLDLPPPLPKTENKEHVTGLSIRLEAAEAQEPLITLAAPAEENKPPTPKAEESKPEELKVELKVEAPPKQEPKVLDSDLGREMPYLFGPKDRIDVSSIKPVDDAIVPGGAANSPDLEILKKYLLLREHDVSVLSAQLRGVKTELESLQTKLVREKTEKKELEYVVSNLKKQLDTFESSKMEEIIPLKKQISELQQQLKSRMDRAQILEDKIRQTIDESDRLKERVRNDIQKIRSRERELENRNEILKRDGEALLSSRETKIIELKRKVDTLEFNSDLLNEKLSQEKQKNADLRDRLDRALQAMKLVGGLLEPNDSTNALEALIADLGEKKQVS